jgi:transposase-like protein
MMKAAYPYVLGLGFVQQKGVRRMEQCMIQNEQLSISSRDILTEILRHGAQKMLAKAVENEVAEYVDAHAHLHDDQGCRLVVRNGHLPARTIRTGIGPVEIQQPRVNDKRTAQDGQRMRFSSNILPPYLRRTHSIDELIPWLYLKGVSTGDFSDALKALLGPESPRGCQQPTLCV